MKQIESLIKAYYQKEIATDSAFSAFTPGIKACIAAKQKQQAQRYFFTFIALFTASLVGFIWSMVILVQQAAASGVGELISMGWSDFGMVSQFWSDFLLSIGENLPIITVMMCLGAALVAALMFRAIFATYEIYYKYNHVYGKN